MFVMFVMFVLVCRSFKETMHLKYTFCLLTFILYFIKSQTARYENHLSEVCYIGETVHLNNNTCPILENQHNRVKILSQLVYDRLLTNDKQLEQWLSFYLEEQNSSIPLDVFWHASGHLDRYPKYSFETIKFKRFVSKNDHLAYPEFLEVFGYKNGRARIKITFSSNKKRFKFLKMYHDKTWLWECDNLPHSENYCWIETTKGCRESWNWFSVLWRVESPWNEKMTSFLNSCIDYRFT